MLIYSMDENRTYTKRRCDAMVKLAIVDPDSEEGIMFCVEHCPYPRCVVFEGKITHRELEAERVRKVKQFRIHGVSVKDIALVLGISKRSVQRDLKK